LKDFQSQQIILSKLNNLDPEQLQEVLNFIDFLKFIVATQVVKTKFLIDPWNGALHFVNTPYISVLRLYQFNKSKIT